MKQVLLAGTAVLGLTASGPAARATPIDFTYTGHLVDSRRRRPAPITRLGQPDGISRSRMAEVLEVDKAGPKVRC